jgi:spore coat protein A
MPGRLTRRAVLRLGGAGALAGVAVVSSPFRSGRSAGAAPRHDAHRTDSADFESVRGPAFEAELLVPPVLAPIARTATEDVYRVTARAATAEIIPGITTPIWGYNGISPGPTIEARKGRRVRLEFLNRVPPNEDPRNLIVPTPIDPEDHPFRPSSLVVHLHGINTDAPFDGHPELTILPGQQFTYRYPNNDYQRPATLWYHDHSVHITGEQIGRASCRERV